MSSRHYIVSDRKLNVLKASVDFTGLWIQTYSCFVTVHSFSCGFEAWDGNGMEWGQWDGEIKSVPIETGVLSRRRKPAQHG